MAMRRALAVRCMVVCRWVDKENECVVELTDQCDNNGKVVL